MHQRFKPIRIQRTRKKKMVSPNKLPIIYVGRPTKWGNPFSEVDINVKVTKNPRQFILKMYKRWLEGEIILDIKPPSRNEICVSLKGKNLACWCKLDDKCHADILLEIANE